MRKTLDTTVFTFKELENVLKKGDDKKRNTLVVDENGNLALVQNDAMSYPVRFEMFCSGNGYVQDLEFLNEDLSAALYDHITNDTIHVTQAEKDF